VKEARTKRREYAARRIGTLMRPGFQALFGMLEMEMFLLVFND
jgi:hypothetical protein